MNVLKSKRNITQFATIVACVFALCCATSTRADSITLKPAVRLGGDGKSITLGDIATIDGPEASKYATLMVMNNANASAAVEISIGEVRTALDKAGVNWALVNLSGRSVIVRPSRDGSAAPPVAMRGMTISNSTDQQKQRIEASEPLSADAFAAQANIRGEITKYIVSGMRCNPKAVRLGFDDADAAFLDGTLNSARLEIEPQSSLQSDRISLVARVWSDGRVQSQRNLSVQARTLVRTAVAKRDMDKDQVVTEEDMTLAEQWMPPSQAGMVLTPVQAVGRAVVRKLNAGETVRDTSLRRDAMVKKGDPVTVRCIVGGVAISMQAEARTDGAEGDTIELRKPGERDTFRAVITGRGQAVVDLRAGKTSSLTNT